MAGNNIYCRHDNNVSNSVIRLNKMSEIFENIKALQKFQIEQLAEEAKLFPPAKELHYCKKCGEEQEGWDEDSMCANCAN